MSYILLTIDIEDWFQVENFKQYIPFSSWSSYELRVEKNTHRLLDLFDSIEVSGSPASSIQHPVSRHPRATFFMLGWLAERLPNLVREIHSRGHEVASHGYCHNLCVECSPGELKRDLNDSKRLLEDIIGDRVYGYRAPSFSINNDILRIIEDGGYLYDSSYNSFGLHGRYGKLNLNGNAVYGIAQKVSDSFYELPISNVRFINRQFEIPWGGGGYFRLIPSLIFQRGVQSIIKKSGAFLFYMHPWEIDPDQPKVKEAPVSYRFRHYVNMRKTYSKLTGFISCFSKCHFMTCHGYISELAEYSC